MLDPGLVAWCERRYDRLVAKALEYHEGLESLLGRRDPAGKGAGNGGRATTWR